MLAALKKVECEVAGDVDFKEGDSTQKKSAPKEQSEHSKKSKQTPFKLHDVMDPVFEKMSKTLDDNELQNKFSKWLRKSFQYTEDSEKNELRNKLLFKCYLKEFESILENPSSLGSKEILKLLRPADVIQLAYWYMNHVSPLSKKKVILDENLCIKLITFLQPYYW